MGELAYGIKATFKRNALQIHIMGECALLHHVSDEVVGNKVHPQFALDHVRPNIKPQNHPKRFLT